MFAEILKRLVATEQLAQDARTEAAQLRGSFKNRAYLFNQATTNGQGVGGPTIVGVVSVPCKGSGIFLATVKCSQAAAAATEVVTMTVTGQTGAGALTINGGVGAGTLGPAPAGGYANVTGGNAGNGLVIAAGGGGEFTIDTQAITVGTAAVGATFSWSGIIQNQFAAVEQPFTRGNNVLLVCKITNSATNRVCNLSMSIAELP